MDERERNLLHQRDLEEQEAHWRTIARLMPRARTLLSYVDEFDEEESERILRCVLPEQMEDKWLVLQDDVTLNFHRSWTGYHIFSVVLDPFEGPTGGVRSRPVETSANRDPEEWTTVGDAYDVSLVRWLLRTLVLGQQLPFPEDPTATGTDALLGAWGIGGNAAFPNSAEILGPDPATGPESEAPPAPDEG